VEVNSLLTKTFFKYTKNICTSSHVEAGIIISGIIYHSYYFFYSCFAHIPKSFHLDNAEFINTAMKIFLEKGLRNSIHYFIVLFFLLYDY
jgi:hypothetical protein